MFEHLTERGVARGERRAAELARRIAGRMGDELPAGLKSEATTTGVRLRGRRLKQRLLLDPALRWIWMVLL
jgi:hypothetical protein